MSVNTVVSASTFQNLDGSNFSTEGVEVKYTKGFASLGGYLGIGTSLGDNSAGMIADVKGSVKYGQTPFSGGFRLRHNVNNDSQTVQLRVQPTTLNIPVSKNTSIYTTPYAAAKLNYGTGKIKPEAGVFAGVSTKIANASVFVEGQIYDFGNINKSNIGINAGVSIPL